MIKKNTTQFILIIIFILHMLLLDASFIFENQHKLSSTIKKHSDNMKDLMLDVIAMKASQNNLSYKDLYYLSLLMFDLENKKHIIKQRNTVYWYSRQG